MLVGLAQRIMRNIGLLQFDLLEYMAVQHVENLGILVLGNQLPELRK
jgi:hypothetical protein